MASKEVLKKRLEYKQKSLENLYKAYDELSDGTVQSYTIGSRSLTYRDLSSIENQIKKLESEVDSLTAQIEGKKRRKAFGVIPIDR